MGSNEFGQLGISDGNLKFAPYPSLIERLVNLRISKIKCGSNYCVAQSGRCSPVKPEMP